MDEVSERLPSGASAALIGSGTGTDRAATFAPTIEEPVTVTDTTGDSGVDAWLEMSP
ncbi:MAG: hypothetical protein U0414_30025 [Polyangiaceae bacterium]